MAKTQSTSQLDRVYRSLVILALLVIGVVLLKDILIPLAFATLFAIVLLPIERRIEKKTGRIFSIVIVLLCVFLIMGLITWFIVSQLTSLVDSLPGLEERFYAALEAASNTLKRFHISTSEQTGYLKEGLQQMSSYLGELLLSTSYLAYFFVQVPIYIFLFLLYREKFKVFFLSFTSGNELIWQKEVEGVIQGYISGLAIVILIAGTLNSTTNMAFTIQLFANSACDPSGFGEGATLIASLLATTDMSGDCPWPCDFRTCHGAGPAEPRRTLLS